MILTAWHLHSPFSPLQKRRRPNDSPQKPQKVAVPRTLSHSLPLALPLPLPLLLQVTVPVQMPAQVRCNTETRPCYKT